MNEKELAELYGNIPVEISEELVFDNQVTASSELPPASLISGAPSSKEIDAMKRVMESLNSVGNGVIKEVVKESKIDPELKSYVQSSLTGSVRVGNVFAINVREIDSLRGKKKVYDIHNTATGELITNDLFLYEAAYAIVKYLNNGKNILGNEIRQVIKLEQDYAAARTDAGMFKVRYNENLKKGNATKTQLYETRFYDSKDKALRIKAELTKIAENIS